MYVPTGKGVGTGAEKIDCWLEAVLAVSRVMWYTQIVL